MRTPVADCPICGREGILHPIRAREGVLIWDGLLGACSPSCTQQLVRTFNAKTDAQIQALLEAQRREEQARQQAEEAAARAAEEARWRADREQFARRAGSTMTLQSGVTPKALSDGTDQPKQDAALVHVPAAMARVTLDPGNEVRRERRRVRDAALAARQQAQKALKDAIEPCVSELEEINTRLAETREMDRILSRGSVAWDSGLHILCSPRVNERECYEALLKQRKELGPRMDDLEGMIEDSWIRPRDPGLGERAARIGVLHREAEDAEHSWREADEAYTRWLEIEREQRVEADGEEHGAFPRACLYCGHYPLTSELFGEFCGQQCQIAHRKFVGNWFLQCDVCHRYFVRNRPLLVTDIDGMRCSEGDMFTFCSWRCLAQQPVDLDDFPPPDDPHWTASLMHVEGPALTPAGRARQQQRILKSAKQRFGPESLIRSPASDSVSEPVPLAGTQSDQTIRAANSDPGHLERASDPAQRNGTIRRNICEVLAGGPVPRQHVLSNVKGRSFKVLQILNELIAEGRVLPEGRGVKGNKRFYRLATPQS